MSLTNVTTDANGCLEQAHNDLTNVSDELAQLYHHVCTVNGETPTRVLLDHEKHINSGCLHSMFYSNFYSIGTFLLPTSILGSGGDEKDKKEKSSEALPDAAAVTRNVETILDQVKHLKIAVNHTIEKMKGGSGNCTDCKICCFICVIGFIVRLIFICWLLYLSYFTFIA